jgi:enterochelin esterase-like enzyme
MQILHQNMTKIMIKEYIIFTVLMCLMISPKVEGQQIPQPGKGKIHFFEKFKSNFVPERDIAVWVPNDYSTKKKYDVLYMHDGQMLFDSNITWNHQEWGVDETAQDLIDQKKNKPFIVVAIWNGQKRRHQEFTPQEAIEKAADLNLDSLILLSKRTSGESVYQGGLQADSYLKFVFFELKPFIDKTFKTHKGREHTYMAGSSMGGLISMYAMCKYPEKLKGIACLSTHWPLVFDTTDKRIFTALQIYFSGKLKDIRKCSRIYMSRGDKTLDSWYPYFQDQMDEVFMHTLKDKKNWISEVFPGDDHSEKSWMKQLPGALEFIMKE